MYLLSISSNRCIFSTYIIVKKILPSSHADDYVQISVEKVKQVSVICRRFRLLCRTLIEVQCFHFSDSVVSNSL